MASPVPSSVLFLLLLLSASLGPLLCLASSPDLASNGFFPDFQNPIDVQTCDGTIGECNPAGEDLMDSEINRRFLAGTGGFISYGALSANRVPCSARGQSYYNCKGSGPANPYKRGCSKITLCQRDTS